jgi:hypothetical protein
LKALGPNKIPEVEHTNQTEDQEYVLPFPFFFWVMALSKKIKMGKPACSATLVILKSSGLQDTEYPVVGRG